MSIFSDVDVLPRLLVRVSTNRLAPYIMHHKPPQPIYVFKKKNFERDLKMDKFIVLKQCWSSYLCSIFQHGIFLSTSVEPWTLWVCFISFCCKLLCITFSMDFQCCWTLETLASCEDVVYGRMLSFKHIHLSYKQHKQQVEKMPWLYMSLWMC